MASVERIDLKINGESSAFVDGLTLLNNSLFVLLKREPSGFDQIAEFGIKPAYNFRRFWSIPGFNSLGHGNDIASCPHNVCIYVSDHQHSSIYQLTLYDAAAARWSINGNPTGISVSKTGNVLVACKHPKPKLIGITPSLPSHVPIKREIVLHEMDDPQHALQLGTNRFIVASNGGQHSPAGRICIVGDDGSVIASFAGKLGSPVPGLDSPCHIAFGGQGLLYVVDKHLKVVVGLDLMAEMRPTVVVPVGVFSPRRLCLVEEESRPSLLVTCEAGSLWRCKLINS